jgi:hypothetical protein
MHAVFQVKFTNSSRPRLVTIRLSNSAYYTRNNDADQVKQWLGRPWFVLEFASARKGTSHVTFASA